MATRIKVMLKMPGTEYVLAEALHLIGKERLMIFLFGKGFTE